MKKFYLFIFILSVIFLSVFFTLPPHRRFVDYCGALSPAFMSAMMVYIAYRQYKVDVFQGRSIFFERRVKALEDFEKVVRQISKLKCDKDYGLALFDNEEVAEIDNNLIRLAILFDILFDEHKVKKFRALFFEAHVIKDREKLKLAKFEREKAFWEGKLNPDESVPDDEKRKIEELYNDYLHEKVEFTNVINELSSLFHKIYNESKDKIKLKEDNFLQ